MKPERSEKKKKHERERKTYESHKGLQILVGGIPGGLAYSFALYAKYIPMAKKIIYRNGCLSDVVRRRRREARPTHIPQYK